MISDKAPLGDPTVTVSGSQTVWRMYFFSSTVGKQGHEAEVHMGLLMAMEER